ncbi:hypothetical protein [Jiella marina]|uniref:hypothetical protein n=1 Tax=Jiella sp. LLJ827 TaxID=2917712 RepID=UPI002101377F|nr:hypothetical protein [Jiella sp. LLJ827]MCQ0990340.1 hypothetical protein [Jiella sp. LLJ827]
MDYTRILAEGVGAWLKFEYACDRSGLFSEKYLSHPIGQILSSRTGNLAQAEYKHPILAELSKGVGRRPEIDSVVCDPYPAINVAVESKWLGKTKPNAKDIMWDLIRLELIANKFNARCFFILGGKRSDLESYFSRKAFSGKQESGMARPLLLHNRNIVHKTNLVPHNNPRVSLLKKLFESYQDFDFPHRLLTRRSAPFPPGARAKDPQVFVWEVMSAPNRETFQPRNSAHYSASGQSRRSTYSKKKDAK